MLFDLLISRIHSLISSSREDESCMAMVAKKKRNEGRMKMNESFDFDSIFQFQIIRLVHKTVQIRVRYFLD